MTLRKSILIAGVATLLAVASFTVGAILGGGAHLAHGATVTCPSSVPVQRCVMVLPGHTGQQITDQHDCFNSTPWMVTDNNGAPEAWLKCGSLYVGGRSGWLGGQICITEVMNPVCLTRADIQWIHSQDGGPMTVSAHRIIPTVNKKDYGDIQFIHVHVAFTGNGDARGLFSIHTVRVPLTFGIHAVLEKRVKEQGLVGWVPIASRHVTLNNIPIKGDTIHYHTDPLVRCFDNHKYRVLIHGSMTESVSGKVVAIKFFAPSKRGVNSRDNCPQNGTG